MLRLYKAMQLHYFENPQRIKAISSDLMDRVQSLVADVEFDLDTPLSDEDEEDCLQVSR